LDGVFYFVKKHYLPDEEQMYGFVSVMLTELSGGHRPQLAGLVNKYQAIGASTGFKHEVIALSEDVGRAFGVSITSVVAIGLWSLLAQKLLLTGWRAIALQVNDLANLEVLDKEIEAVDRRMGLPPL
jgi:hypothetical protein